MYVCLDMTNHSGIKVHMRTHSATVYIKLVIRVNCEDYSISTN